MVQCELDFRPHKTTQKDLILAHLELYGSITSWEAIQKFRCTRISEYIRQLRQDEHNIETEWKSNGKKHWGEYRLIK